VQRAILRQPLNGPKYLLLAAAIPMHWIVLLTPMPAKPIALVAILTIYHNLQYHRLIWFHNKKYVRPSPQAERGWGEVESRANPTLTLPARGEGTTRQPEATTPAVHHAQDARATFGPAAFISRRLIYYIGFGILFGLMYQAPRQILGYFGLKATHGVPTAALPVAIQLGVAVLWSVAFIHYYLDSKIWRVRRDPAVGEALKMA